MGTGTLVGALCQDTTTSTGTGAITLAGVVPAGAPAGSTTFAAQFGSTPQVAPGNTFYAIIDGSGNIEVGLGTFNGTTTLTRDYVLGAFTGGVISLATQVAPSTHVNFAAGTKNVYSNPNLLASSCAAWARIPDDNAANIFQNIMSGTFVGSMAINGLGATNITLRYKVTNEGDCVISSPAAVTVNQAATTNLIISNVPAFLTNVQSAGCISTVGAVTSNAANSVGALSVTPGATPTTLGSFLLLNGATLANLWTTGVANGLPAGASFIYPLF